MRKLLALLLLAPGMAWGQSTWTLCATTGGTCAFTGTKQVRFGSPLGTPVWTAPKIATGGVPCTVAYFGEDPRLGSYKECNVMDVAGPPPPPPTPPPPVWTGDMVLAWTAPAANDDGSPLVPPVTYRVTVDGAVRATVAALKYTATGLAAGQHCATVATVTGSGMSVESGSACVTLAANPVCPAKPADDAQTMQCVAPAVGSWTQTRTYASAAYPTCWATQAWTPAAAPAGACTTPQPVDVCVSDPLVITNVAWPTAQSGRRSLGYNTGAKLISSIVLTWPNQLVFTDARGCSVTVTR